MILLDNFVFELQSVGGVSKYWAKNIERLDRAALDITFLEGPDVKNNAFRRDLTFTQPVITERGTVTVRRVRGPQVVSDVFHSSYYRVSKNSKFNIVTIHDFMNEKFPSSFRDPILARIKKRACRHADRIVVVSECTRKDLLRHYPDVDPGIVEVIYNGADEEFFPEPISEPFNVMGERIVPFRYFLYVGTRGYCKNFPYVLSILAKAWSKGLEYRLVIVGGGPLSSRELASAAALGLPPTTFLQISGIDNATLRRLYSNTSALLIPSIYEGFGLPALEAARCGALVLASRGSALDEIIGETDYAFDLNAKNEIPRVLSLGFDNANAEAERARLLKRSDMFSWDRSVKRLIEIYDELGH
ncbi:glycosyltransferase family 4 protein [Halomonas sp. EGI 63088]|uniref:Glycosyltransferase family 4 protein n=1 Tax=Halomonas flagellata TaxID=2920385 RepID=A0ABS9S0A0_9GAMM|nr:glycosyltransferase family 1 protein [Halomonas flagellata]MCH4565440.1 glycosyltransferase family 4 protein [Halomonas flagellata]